MRTKKMGAIYKAGIVQEEGHKSNQSFDYFDYFYFLGI